VKVRIALAALAGAATLAMVGVAAAAPSASASTIPTTTVSHVSYAPPGCRTSQLSATLTSGPQTQWNRRDLVLTLTNTSRWPCTVSGYPGLQLLSIRYWALPTTTVPIPGRTFQPAHAVLFPGQSVRADITFSVLGRFYPAVKNPAPSFGQQSDAVYLMVTLPGTHQGYGQHFVLKIPGGPVRIVQDRLYETPLMGYVPINW
jgi:Protein of unknown function (DUF4232)